MIVSWYRRQIREFGALRATWLLLRIAANRARVNLSNRFLRARVECPCCGWRGHRFLDYLEMGYRAPRIACPNCDSHARHRALFLWLRDTYRISERTGRAIVFAPERALNSLWATARNLTVHRVDLDPARQVDLIADITHLPFASDAADLIWCHHVLEQVEDDVAALLELRRVCAPSGEAIVSVAIGDQLDTQEYGYANRAISGNWRRFGRDFSALLASAGFTVQPLECELSETERRAYGIGREKFYRCTTD